MNTETKQKARAVACLTMGLFDHAQFGGNVFAVRQSGLPVGAFSNMTFVGAELSL